MEQCPIKEMEIKFQCVIDTENSLFEPVPARNIKPEWYKQLSPMVETPTGEKIDSIKKCPAMHDWLSMGYLIRNRHTILVWMGEHEDPTHGKHKVCLAIPLVDDIGEKDIKKLKSFTTPDDLNEYVKTNGLILAETFQLGRSQDIGGHPAIQVQGSSWDDKMCFKFKMDFLIETPKGTSCYYLDPFLFDNPNFTTWQGVIDTDNFNQVTTNNMLICYPKSDKTFFINKGTPLVQIVPFVRYPWKHTIEYLSPVEVNKRYNQEMKDGLQVMNDRRESNRKEHQQVYRKNYASKKEFK